jgi:hypothetical protein
VPSRPFCSAQNPLPVRHLDLERFGRFSREPASVGGRHLWRRSRAGACYALKHTSRSSPQPTGRRSLIAPSAWCSDAAPIAVYCAMSSAVAASWPTVSTASSFTLGQQHHERSSPRQGRRAALPAGSLRQPARPGRGRDRHRQVRYAAGHGRGLLAARRAGRHRRREGRYRRGAPAVQRLSACAAAACRAGRAPHPVEGRRCLLLLAEPGRHPQRDSSASSATAYSTRCARSRRATRRLYARRRRRSCRIRA